MTEAVRWMQYEMPGRAWRQAARCSLAGICLAVLCGGCISRDADKETPDDVPAAQLLEQGLAGARAGDNGTAAERFEQLDRLYPFSAEARRALVNLAYLDYANGDYTDAAGRARRFLNLYPADAMAGYMRYLLGQAYFRQILDVERDQEMTRRALAAFQRVVDSDPDSQYAESAQEKIRIAQDQLAGHEMAVGRFYLTGKNYGAAIGRYNQVIENYPQTRHIEEALYRLTEAYYALGVVQEARRAAVILGHNYPASPWYRDAYTLVETGQTQERARNRFSIERLFR